MVTEYSLSNYGTKGANFCHSTPDVHSFQAALLNLDPKVPASNRFTTTPDRYGLGVTGTSLPHPQLRRQYPPKAL